MIAGTKANNSIPAEPAKIANSGVITYDLSGLRPARLKSTVRGDWPVGDEEQLRKVISVRIKGKSTQYITLIEPFEDKSAIKSATAQSANEFQVELTDGRLRRFTISGLDSPEGNLSVKLTEEKEGQKIR